LRKPTPAELHEMRQAWGDGRSGVASYLSAVLSESALACVEGEGPDLHRKQGEARTIKELIGHFSGTSAARRVENPTAQVAVTKPI